MTDTASQKSSDVKYTAATPVGATTIPTTDSSEISRQRVVTASHTRELVVLRFTPRTVPRSAAESKTS
jgi:hypothetical protein